jgi:hypothetical protein
MWLCLDSKQGDRLHSLGLDLRVTSGAMHPGIDPFLESWRPWWPLLKTRAMKEAAYSPRDEPFPINHDVSIFLY